MISQDLDGFLSSNIENTINRIESLFKDWFVVSKDVNRYAHKIITSIRFDTKDLQEAYIAVLLIRALGTFQGIVILCERGMAAQSRIVLRCLVELLFMIRAGSKDRELVEKIVHEDKKTRLKLLSKLKACSENTRQDLIDFPDDNYEKELKSFIEENKISEIKTRHVAEKAGLSDFYNTAYALLSMTVHTKIGDLDEHFQVDENNEIVSFHLGPEIRNIGLYLLSAIECMFLIFDTLIEFFKVEHDPALDNLIGRFRKLAEESKFQEKESYRKLKIESKENDSTQA